MKAKENHKMPKQAYMYIPTKKKRRKRRQKLSEM